jgi:hypothetical protein
MPRKNPPLPRLSCDEHLDRYIESPDCAYREAYEQVIRYTQDEVSTLATNIQLDHDGEDELGTEAATAVDHATLILEDVGSQAATMAAQLQQAGVVTDQHINALRTKLTIAFAELGRLGALDDVVQYSRSRKRHTGRGEG